MSDKSLAERKKAFLEDCCGGGGGPTMSMGADGYQGAAPAEGPMAGFAPVMGGKKKKLNKVIGKLRKEGYVGAPDAGKQNVRGQKFKDLFNHICMITICFF